MTAYDPRAGVYVGGDDFGVPAASPPPMSDRELEELVRFEHPAKLLSVAELPGAAQLGDGALASAYRTDPETLRELRTGFRRSVRNAALELLAGGALVQAVRRLQVPAGGTIVALGDSITDDRLSWAEILRECLQIVRPLDAIAVVNAGVSGDTTADVWRRLYGVLRLDADLVITLLGTNDCQRHGPGGELLVAAGESARNLASIVGWLGRSRARRVWITPPPVQEDALARAVGDRPFSVRDADVRAIARVVHGLGEPVVDLHEVLGSPPRRGLLMDDGVHPSLAGQTAIAGALLRALGPATDQASVAGSAPSHIQSGAGNP